LIFDDGEGDQLATYIEDYEALPTDIPRVELFISYSKTMDIKTKIDTDCLTA
jgi:hypothetical protein